MVGTRPSILQKVCDDEAEGSIRLKCTRSGENGLTALLYTNSANTQVSVGQIQQEAPNSFSHHAWFGYLSRGHGNLFCCGAGEIDLVTQRATKVGRGKAQ